MSEEKEPKSLFETIFVENSTAIVAVMLGISTFIGNNLDDLRADAESKSQEATEIYDALEQKNQDYNVEIDELNLEIENSKAEDSSYINSKIEYYKNLSDSLSKEQTKAEQVSKESEELYVKIEKKTSTNHLSEIFFQLAVLFSAVATSTKKKFMVYIATATTAIGTLLAIWAALL
ncbi:MAG: DUF4337 family protein [Bacteroidetes bacterium]|nr:MAG: DUF4337 family protein [Bacteroidota bacterium]